jgi:hypothetical protein
MAAPPGSFGNVDVRAGAIWTLAGPGTYEVQNLLVRAGGRVLANDSVTLKVAGTIQVLAGAMLKPNPAYEHLTAKAMMVEAGSSATAVDVRAGAQMRALLVAPIGGVNLAAGAMFSGAMAVHRFNSGNGAMVTYEDGLDAASCLDLCRNETFDTTVTIQTLRGTLTPLPAASSPTTYLVKYEDGCMKYNQNQWWAVNALAGTFSWYLVGSTTANVISALPGTEGFFQSNAPPVGIKPGFEDFDQCVDANLTLDPIVVEHPGGALNLYLKDTPYDDNQPGHPSPSWSLTRIAVHGGCAQAL